MGPKLRVDFGSLEVSIWINGLEAIYDYVNRHEGVLHWNGEQIYAWYQPIANQRMKAAE